MVFPSNLKCKGHHQPRNFARELATANPLQKWNGGKREERGEERWMKSSSEATKREFYVVTLLKIPIASVLCLGVQMATRGNE